MVSDVKTLRFEKVKGTDAQVKILFSLLSSRKHSISHLKVPNYEDHRNFVISNPYRIWFIIFINSEAVGSFYLQNDNSIGLNINCYNSDIIDKILTFINEKFKPMPSVPSLIPPFFYLNVSYKNSDLRKVLMKRNLIPLQISYKLN